MRSHWHFAGAGDLVFGWESIRQLGPELVRRGFRKVFILADPALVKHQVVSTVLSALSSFPVVSEVYAGGVPEPSIATCLDALAAAQACRPDAVIGLGGGSNMDLAKLVAALLAHGGHPKNYFGFDAIPGPTIPVVAIPTTAGTGSEVSHAAVLTDTELQLKVSTLSPHLRPTLALVDPSLTLTCPRQATADSGIDALTHAIEAFTAVDYRMLAVPDSQTTPYSGKNPVVDALAEKAIGLIGKSLIKAVLEPSNREAREDMALAATLAGMAFSNGAVAVVHALEYPIGAQLHVSHGCGNGLLLPFVMRYNLEVRTREFAQIARWLGVSAEGLSERALAEGAIRKVEEIKKAVGIPDRLRDIGAKSDQLPGFAQKSFGIKRLMNLNPRLPSESELLRVLEDAY